MFWQTTDIHRENIKKDISISVRGNKFIFIVILTCDEVKRIEELFKLILLQVCFELIVVHNV